MGDMGAGSGMLIVETIAKIRRAHFVQQKPIKAICREFRVSRKVVRKVIRSGATEFRYERGKQPLPRIDPWRGQLDGLLLANEGRSARERLTLIRIFEELRALGYEGSYDAVRRYVSELAVSNPGSRSIRRWQPQGLRLCVTSQMNLLEPHDNLDFCRSHDIVFNYQNTHRKPSGEPARPPSALLQRP
jgi:hypothetical protein